MGRNRNEVEKLGMDSLDVRKTHEPSFVTFVIVTENTFLRVTRKS